MESWMGPGAFAARYAGQPDWRWPGGRLPRHPPMPAPRGHRRSPAHQHAGASAGGTTTESWGARGRSAARGWLAWALRRALTAGQ